jgi:hypothetical protein
MAAGRYDFTIEQGATTNFELQYKDNKNNPIDLTNYNGRMQIRPFVGSDDVYLTLSSSLGPCGTGINMNGSNGITPPTSGSIGVYISAHSSSLLDWDNKAYYDLELYTSDDNDCMYVVRLIQGKVKLSKEITITP